MVCKVTEHQKKWKDGALTSDVKEFEERRPVQHGRRNIEQGVFPMGQLGGWFDQEFNRLGFGLGESIFDIANQMLGSLEDNLNEGRQEWQQRFRQSAP
jgi:hypothetical protein